MSEAPNADEPVAAVQQPLAPSEPIPVGVEHASGDVPAAAAEQTLRRTDAQATKLNVLVGTLRDAQHISTAGLYDAIAGLRGIGGEDLVLQVGGYDMEHELHWAPLRDALTRPEASKLIDWLETKEQRVKEATA